MTGIIVPFDPIAQICKGDQTATMMMNEMLQKKIAQALQANPSLQGLALSVAMEGDAVVLYGFVDLFSKKALALKIAKDVSGKKVYEAIQVKVDQRHVQRDEELSLQITECFRRNFSDSHINIQVKVTRGYVELEGMLKWKYQLQLATECIGHIEGIQSIKNNITTAR